ncbi:MAG: dTDP-4-amino-4,6-dideoxygalactose transaminase [Bacteroidales bacterium]
MQILFNKPYIPWISLWHLIRGTFSGTIAGNGTYTKKCHRFFEDRFGFNKVLMTTSCSDALEMSALLCRIGPGDEVIMPSFTFMSTANAFIIRGAKVVFADTLPDVPNIDPRAIEPLITPRTKAIVVVHYSGLACDMDTIMEIAARHNLFVVEDAAHAIDSFYRGKPLGSIGHFGTFSFHETKNIISGEGGLLIINQPEFAKRAEIIWDKGTNRAAFYRGEIDKYGWVDIGSSYLPSDSVAAFLFTQISRFDRIQSKRKKVWWNYYEALHSLEESGRLKRPVVPDYATVNGNIFYITLQTPETRDKLMAFLKARGINALFHYLPLHSSPYFIDKHDGRELPNTDMFSSCILRLPFYNSLKKSQINYIVKSIGKFCEEHK